MSERVSLLASGVGVGISTLICQQISTWSLVSLLGRSQVVQLVEHDWVIEERLVGPLLQHFP